MTYPRVLIYSSRFGPLGDTIVRSLFKGWPKEKIAICLDGVLYKNLEFCEYNYSAEVTKPLYLEHILSHLPKQSIFYKLYYHIFILIKFIIKDNLKIDMDFVNFVKKFKPDILYTIVYSPLQIPDLLAINKKLNIPLAIHILDDWINRPVDIYLKYEKYYGKKLMKELIGSSKLLLSICEDMSDEYYLRYGRKFYAFTNSINFSEWNGKSKNDWYLSNPVKIMYAGTVEEYNIIELITLCKACKELGINVYLYVKFRKDFFYNMLKVYDNCIIQEYVSHSEIIELYKKYDILFLPFSFEKKFQKNISLSLPSKTPEYMASKTPILVYSPQIYPVYKYASKEGWGYVVDKPGVQELKNGIKSLISSYDLREKLGEKAYTIAYQNYNQSINQQKLIYLINEAINS